MVALLQPARTTSKRQCALRRFDATACSVDQDTSAQILTVAYRPSVQLKVIAGVVNIGIAATSPWRPQVALDTPRPCRLIGVVTTQTESGFARFTASWSTVTRLTGTRSSGHRDSPGRDERRGHRSPVTARAATI